MHHHPRTPPHTHTATYLVCGKSKRAKRSTPFARYLKHTIVLTSAQLLHCSTKVN